MEVPVKLPNKGGTTMARVSAEDYDDVIRFTDRWRMTSSGYVVYVTHRGGAHCYKTMYLHWLIQGGPARHINGDRLDCRRENLTSTSRKSRDRWEREHTDVLEQIRTFRHRLHGDTSCPAIGS